MNLLEEGGLFAALNTQKTDITEQTETTEEPASLPSESPDPSAFDLEAQQKAFQRFTSSLGLGNFRAPFNMNVLPPFLAALQQNPLSMHQQLLGLTGGLSGVSPGPDEEEETNNGGEPEDLTVGLRKERSCGDDTGVHDLSGEMAAHSTGGQTWSYEEQFKQLYELNDDPKRKEWLDDWLGFMHRIGKPVTRIPIMAKQVLDLYELYRLVVQHGGLVEIINKKLWREITKGLNLPSSITSAAFTLRTQYQKFLYDYECEKEALSNPADLQQAIDGNRREGRRTGGGPPFGLGYPAMPHPQNLLQKLNGGLGLRNDFLDAEESNPLLAAYRAEQMAMFAEQQRHIERAQRAAVEAVARQTLGLASGRESSSSIDSDGHPTAKRPRVDESPLALLAPAPAGPAPALPAPSPSKPTTAGSANLKITHNNKGGEDGNSLVVSMEINGVTYQGVLFAITKEESAASN